MKTYDVTFQWQQTGHTKSYRVEAASEWDAYCKARRTLIAGHHPVWQWQHLCTERVLEAARA